MAIVWHRRPRRKMPLLPCERVVFTDVETAGLGIACPIIQIAAISVDSRLRELETFEVKIRFQSAARSKRSPAASKESKTHTPFRPGGKSASSCMPNKWTTMQQ